MHHCRAHPLVAQLNRSYISLKWTDQSSKIYLFHYFSPVSFFFVTFSTVKRSPGRDLLACLAATFCGADVTASWTTPLVLLSPVLPSLPQLLGSVSLLNLALHFSKASVSKIGWEASCMPSQLVVWSVSPAALPLSSGHTPWSNPPPIIARKQQRHLDLEHIPFSSFRQQR